LVRELRVAASDARLGPEGASGLRGTRASGSSGFPLKTRVVGAHVLAIAQ